MSDICKNDGTYFNQFGVCETCGNTRAEQDAAEAAPAPASAPVQKFCMNCGAQLNGAAFCAACGTAAGQSGASAPKRASIDVKAVIKDAWDHVRAFFTANPFSSVRNAALSVNPIWMAIAAGVCLLAALGFFSACNYNVYAAGGERISLIYLVSMLIVMMKELTGMVDMGSLMYMDGLGNMDSTGMMEKVEKIGKTVGHPVALFFILLLLMIVVFFACAALVKVFFLLTKKDVSWKKSFNIYSVSLMPFALFSAAAFIVGFMSPFVAVAILLMGSLFHYICLYFGIQKAVSFEKSPFWLYPLLVIAQYVAVYLVVLLFFAIFC